MNDAPSCVDGHPPGTILIAGSDLSRYAAFSLSLLGLIRPAGTVVTWNTGANIARNLNDGIDLLHGEWVWRIDDDQVFTPDTLLKLLNHQVSLVAPLCLHRKPPFHPVLYRERLPDGSYLPWPTESLPAGGLHEVCATGGSGLLIRREVFAALTKPYFEIGQLRTDDLSEDLYFQRKAQRAGFRVYVDLETTIGHITPMVVWPTRDAQGQWVKFVDTTGSLSQHGVGRSGQGSHADVLAWCIEHTTGPVLELGMGVESTPLLHRLCTQDNRLLVSFDDQAEWVEYFAPLQSPSHVIRCFPSWQGADEALMQQEWSVALIDETAGHRAHSVALLQRQAEMLIVHDTQPSTTDYYQYGGLLDGFRWHVVDKRGTPWTTICSHRQDLAPLALWLKSMGNPV